MTFDDDQFLDWLDSIDGGYVDAGRVNEEWPTFHKHYSLGGVTITVGEDGESLVPKRDYRDVVIHGQPRD
jgi:hypothetical protein